MSSNSDMESVSISDVEMEEDEQVAPVTSSQPVPHTQVPAAGISLPKPSSQPTPRRVTMRERALAMREARLKKSQAKSATKQSAEATGKDPTEKGTDDVRGDDSENRAAASAPRHKPAQRKSPRSSSKAAPPESVVEPNKQDSQPLASKHHNADGKKAEAHGTAKAKKAQSRREANTRKGAKTATVLPKSIESSTDLGSNKQNGPHGAVPNGHSAPSKDLFEAPMLSLGTRRDQKKRKSTVDLVQGKDAAHDSGSESDVILLQSKANATAPPRARKKARVDSAKPPTSPKTTSKSLKKKKEKAIPPLPADPIIVAPVTVVPVDLQQNEAQAPSRKKKASKKTTRAELRALEEDEPILVRDKRVGKPAAQHSSKDPPASKVAEQTPKPVPPKRRPGRPRKYPKVDASDTHPPVKATVEEEHSSKAKEDKEESVPEKKTQRQTKPRGRKAKRGAPDDSESAKKPAKEDGDDFEVSKVRAAPRQASRSASRLKAPGQTASEPASNPTDDHDAPGHVGIEKPKTKRAKTTESKVQGNEGSMNTVTQSPTRTKGVSANESVLQSITKSKRLSFAPSATPRGTSVMQRSDLGKRRSRRQSLSHQEGLSRLTSVVDQLQREGESFLQAEHRICDQLVPFAPDSPADLTSSLPHGSVGAPVSEDDRKAIADAALRDAVMHAKLEYQANHRAAISKLAENLVKAVKDWKNAKNAVLRDIIPEELRPEAEVPVENADQIEHSLEAPNTPGATDVTDDSPEDIVPDEKGEEIDGLDKNENPETASNVISIVARKDREEAVARIRVLHNAEAVKKYVGFSYADLELSGYRPCAILKLCEFDQGLSYDELYDKTPFGKNMLKKNINLLVVSKYLVERTLETASGQKILVYSTVPNISTMI